VVLGRAAFSVKLMKLKLWGPSLTCAPYAALGRALNTFVPNFLFVIVYYFFIKMVPNFYRLQGTQTLDPCLALGKEYLLKILPSN